MRMDIRMKCGISKITNLRSLLILENLNEDSIFKVQIGFKDGEAQIEKMNFLENPIEGVCNEELEGNKAEETHIVCDI